MKWMDIGCREWPKAVFLPLSLGILVPLFEGINPLAAIKMESETSVTKLSSSVLDINSGVNVMSLSPSMFICCNKVSLAAFSRFSFWVWTSLSASNSDSASYKSAPAITPSSDLLPYQVIVGLGYFHLFPRYIDQTPDELNVIISGHYPKCQKIFLLKAFLLRRLVQKLGSFDRIYLLKPLEQVKR